MNIDRDNPHSVLGGNKNNKQTNKKRLTQFNTEMDK